MWANRFVEMANLYRSNSGFLGWVRKFGFNYQTGGGTKIGKDTAITERIPRLADCSAVINQTN